MSVQIGCGLIGIGRHWGYIPGEIPEEEQVKTFLDTAINLGISFFDTAPSYGLSEERLGNFLKTLSSNKRKPLTIATKCGEHWDAQTQSAYADHSYNALKQSIDKSISRLRQIDLLQLHKTTPETLQSSEVKQALEYARTLGVHRFGVSISDIKTGLMACSDERFSTIQLPYNTANTKLEKVIETAQLAHKFIVINRPFNMGETMNTKNTGQSVEEIQVNAFQFILNKHFDGVILTGTKSPEHLRHNVQSFQKAMNRK